jgi:hypothetical protein
MVYIVKILIVIVFVVVVVVVVVVVMTLEFKHEILMIDFHTFALKIYYLKSYYR